MSELSFLNKVSDPAAAFKAVLLCEKVPDQFSETEIEKIKCTAEFLLKTEAGKRESILSELGCSGAASVADLIGKYEEYVNSSADHNLVDFDWSASIVLGTKNISNLKEPIATFRFKLTDGSNPAVEFTAEEADEFLKQLEAAKAAQSSLLPK